MPKNLPSMRQSPRSELHSDGVQVNPEKYDPELEQSALDLLNSDPDLQALSDDIAEDPLRWIDSAADFISLVSRKKHLNAIAFAYAVWLRSFREGAYKQFVVNLRREQIRQDRRRTDLHLIVDRLINYGEADSDLASGSRRGLRNRDVSAILHLHSYRIGPSGVEDQAAKPGEGLDTWARNWSSQKKSLDVIAPISPQRAGEIHITVLRIDAQGHQVREKLKLTDDENVRSLIGLSRRRLIASS